MAYKLRESSNERFDSSLPSIYSGSRSRAPIATLDDSGRYARPVSPTGAYHKDRVFYPRPLSPPRQRALSPRQRALSPTRHDVSRQQMLDLQEQVRTYRDEAAKKDRLISQLTSVDSPRIARMDTSHIDELYASERIASVATAKSEVAGLSVRVDGLQAQVRELQGQLDIREEKIRELKLHLETTKESEAKHVALVHTLNVRLGEFEAQAGSLEGAASRSEVAIQTLQRQNREQQERILDLEARLRSHAEDRGRYDLERQTLEKKHNELWTQLSSLMAVDVSFNATSHETLIRRVTDMMEENACLRGKISAMKEYVTNAELETKASRETIIRLVSDAEREQRTVSKYTVEYDQLKQDREVAVSRQREMEREIDLLKERLDASQRAWNATRTELEEREARFGRNESQLKEFEIQSRTVEQSFRSFKEQVSALLSDSYVTVEPYEEQIRERLTALVRSTSDRKAHIEMLEGKVSSLTTQLDGQLDHQRGAERRAQKAEGDVFSIEERLRRAEGELAAGDVLRDGMRVDRERYLRFLEQLSLSLKMDPITADMGMDGAAEAILGRVHQIVGKEADLLVDRKTHIYNLQRKIKALKEQLDSKDLHMDLLRKKVASLEERAVGRSDVEREKDEEFVKNRKLLKLVDKYKQELNECRLEIRDLKARILESADLRNRNLEQVRDLESLEEKVGQLEHVRHKQAQKIKGLKCELDDTLDRFGEKKEVAHHTVQSLTSELRTTKMALEEMSNRERQLLDLRQVMARMLGMDVNSLAVPDYEIIARLEKLILANQSNAATVVALDTALEDVSDGFRVGYENATRRISTRSRSPVKVTRSMGSGSLRTRSMSPARRDPRKY